MSIANGRNCLSLLHFLHGVQGGEHDVVEGVHFGKCGHVHAQKAVFGGKKVEKNNRGD